MYKLNYISKGDLCDTDFLDKLKIEYLNLRQISSISDIKSFDLPFSRHVSNYAIVTMQNNNVFYIDENECEKLLNVTNWD